MYQLNVEAVITMAFIESLENNQNQKFLSYKEISEFGYKLADLVRERTGINTLFLFYRNTIDECLYHYDSFFVEEVLDNIYGIKLKEDITSEKLINKFLGSLPLDILLTFYELKKVYK